MKIYILRHEDRTRDCSFFSPLTLVGLENAEKLIDILKKCKINKIYSSPFIRTLQTIYPYCNKTNKTINIEYGLSELHHQDIISKNAAGISLPEYLAEAFCYNSEYKTIIIPSEIKYPEKEIDVLPRIKKVLKEIITHNYKTDNNIIIVTHQAICIAVLKIVNKFSNEFKNKISRDNLTNYPKGRLCLVFNNNWTYLPIN